MSTAESLNLGLRFVLELCTLAAVGYWGWQAGDSVGVKLALGVGSPLVVAVVWGLVVSPKARLSLPDAARLLVEVCVFGAGVAALALAGRGVLAGVLAAFVVGHELASTRFERW